MLSTTERRSQGDSPSQASVSKPSAFPNAINARSSVRQWAVVRKGFLEGAEGAGQFTSNVYIYIGGQPVEQHPHPLGVGG